TLALENPDEVVLRATIERMTTCACSTTVGHGILCASSRLQLRPQPSVPGKRVPAVLVHHRVEVDETVGPKHLLEDHRAVRKGCSRRQRSILQCARCRGVHADTDEWLMRRRSGQGPVCEGIEIWKARV